MGEERSGTMGISQKNKGYHDYKIRGILSREIRGTQRRGIQGNESRGIMGIQSREIQVHRVDESGLSRVEESEVLWVGESGINIVRNRPLLYFYPISFHQCEIIQVPCLTLEPVYCFLCAFYFCLDIKCHLFSKSIIFPFCFPILVIPLPNKK